MFDAVDTFTGPRAGRVLARLQSILLNEKKEEGRSSSDISLFSSKASDFTSMVGDGLGIAGTVLGWVPKKKSKSILVKIENNSNFVLIPTRFHCDDTYYSVKKGMVICEPNNEVGIEIETVGKYKPEKARFVITFAVGEKNREPIKLELNIETNEENFWIIRKYVHSTIIGDTHYTDTSESGSSALTLTIFRETHADRFPSVAVAFYATTSETNDSQIKIAILPWREEAYIW